MVEMDVALKCNLEGVQETGTGGGLCIGEEGILVSEHMTGLYQGSTVSQNSDSECCCLLLQQGCCRSHFLARHLKVVDCLFHC